MSKRPRAVNLTECEKILLVDLALKYKPLIENKKTDAVSTSVKENGWRQLTDEFNAASTSSVKRECQQLKNAFENLKQKAKKAVANDKVESSKTGGGTFVRQVSQIDEKLLELLGHRATPLTNPYDADALYNHEAAYSNETVVYYNELVWNLAVDSATPESATAVDAVTPAAAVVSVAANTSASITTATSSTSALPQLLSIVDTDGLMGPQPGMPVTTITSENMSAALSALASSAPALSAPSAAASSAPAASTSALSAPASAAMTASATASRKRRRDRPAGTVRETAANAVCEAAKSQREYYDAKLQMAKEKHGAKMRILALKEQILKKKLREE